MQEMWKRRQSRRETKWKFLSKVHIDVNLSFKVYPKEEIWRGGGHGMSPKREIKRPGMAGLSIAVDSLAVCGVGPFCWNHKFQHVQIFQLWQKIFL